MFAPGLSLTSDTEREVQRKCAPGVCEHVLFKDEHMLPIIHLSDLRCHLRCPHRHHLAMLWLDLHLETYQHEPAVCPGKRKGAQRGWS